MNDNPGFANYRAVLGDGAEKAFAIVTVMEHGSISWSIVTEHEFNDANYNDIPQDLFEQVNDAYRQLSFLDDDIADDNA